MTQYLTYAILIIVVVGLNTIAQQFLKQRWNLWLGYGVSALCMMLFLWNASTPPRHDWFGDFYGGYYPAGHLITQNRSELYNFKGDYGFVNIPIIALLFTPLATLNKTTAVILFTFLGGSSVLATCYFLVRLTKVLGWRRIALLGLFVINGPLYHSLWYGNLTHFVLPLLLAAWFCLEKQRDFWLGILLAIAAMIKLPLFLLGVYFALKARWHVVAGFAVALSVIIGASLLLFGLDLHLAWLDHIRHFSGKAVSAYNVQSIDAFLVRLRLYTTDELTNWAPTGVGWKFKIIRYPLLSLLVGTTIWICWRSRPPKTVEVENLEFSIVLCLALVISPISWTHYYLLLLLPFSLYFGNRLAIPQGRLWFILVLASIFLTSLPVLVASPANPVLRFLYSKLLISHYLFGGILLLGVLLAARRHTLKHSKLSQGHAEV